MSFPVYSPSAKTTAEIVEAIPRHLRDDPWVVYHGTSDASASIIERDGFNPKIHFGVERIVDRIVKLYEKIGWWGEHPNGFPVLKSFSSFDYARGRDGVTFFAIHPNQASLYATTEFQGGEKSTAIRLALNDLRLRMNTAETIDDTLHALDLELIGEFLSSLDEGKRFVDEVASPHPGVLYAVRLTDKDLNHLDYNGHMGLMSNRPVSVDRICMKLFVPTSCKWKPHFSSLADVERLTPAGNLLLSAMAERRQG